MLLRVVFLALLGVSFGLLAAAGVFTVLVSVGLVPRFAGKTHTAKKIFLYEEMVVAGTLTGCVVSVFAPFLEFNLGKIPGTFLIGIYGLFAGMFVGCLALAIAEMLNSIPIFARRISFRHGLGLVILSIAIGKMLGSLLYFYMNITPWK